MYYNRDLARNEEFSEIAVINIFFTVLKTKTQLSVGGGGGRQQNSVVRNLNSSNKTDHQTNII